MNTPVLFLIFNRSETAARVFRQIRKMRPPALYIAADGPRPNRIGEAKLCEQTRRTILSLIDWPCEIKTLFREKNLGCKQAISSAITWFFEHVEEGIILEDDCLPDLSFFRFCEELLKKYRDNERIMMVSGNCHLNKPPPISESYYFSHFTYIWGWATWKRAWEHMDLRLQNPTILFPDGLSPHIRKWWGNTFEQNRDRGSSWAIAWQFSCWNRQGLSINPAKNLVSHIDTEGTHMKPYDPAVCKSRDPVEFPLIHPSCITPQIHFDLLTENLMRRTFFKNIQLISTYLIRLFAGRETSVKQGLAQLALSLKCEMDHRRALHKRR